VAGTSARGIKQFEKEFRDKRKFREILGAHRNRIEKREGKYRTVGV